MKPKPRAHPKLFHNLQIIPIKCRSTATASFFHSYTDQLPYENLVRVVARSFSLLIHDLTALPGGPRRTQFLERLHLVSLPRAHATSPNAPPASSGAYISLTAALAFSVKVLFLSYSFPPSEATCIFMPFSQDGPVSIDSLCRLGSNGESDDPPRSESGSGS